MAIRNNVKDSVTITGTSSADTIHNSGDDASIDAGAGDDSIDNNGGDNASIDAGDGDDSIRNLSAYEDEGHYVTIDGGAGNDKITNVYGDHASINAGAGNDLISDRSWYSTLIGGAGNDSIVNNDGDGTIIVGGEGDDTIEAYYASDMLIDGGAGNDEIYSNGSNSNVTIDAGTGNDFISSSGENNLIIYSGGNDTIEGFDEDYSTLKIASGSMSSLINSNGNDLIISVGNNTITLKAPYFTNKLNIIDANGKPIPYEIQIVGSDGADKIINSIKTTKVNSHGGNDEIHNTGENVTINSGDGSNYIYNSGNGVSITVGDGVNTINSNGNGLSIVTGNGPNYINSNGVGNSITTGKGPDSLYATSNDSDNNYFNTGGGPDYVNTNSSNTRVDLGPNSDYYYGCPNTRNNLVNGEDGPDTLESDGPNSTLNGGKQIDKIYSRGKGSKSNGGPDIDFLANGDNENVGDDIESQRDKAKDSADELYDTAKEQINQVKNEPWYQDILENGANSDYLNLLSPENRKMIADLIKSASDLNSVAEALKITKDVVSSSMKEIEVLEKYANDLTKANELLKSAKILENPALLDELYTPLKNFIENDSKWGPPRATSLFDKFKVAYAANKEASTLSEIAGKTTNMAKMLKGLKYVGTAIEVYEFGKAVYDQVSNPSAANFDNVMLEGIDVLSSTIPIPLVDIAARELGRAAYQWGANAVRENFAKANSVRSSKTRLMAFYINSSNNIVDSETPEDFYMNDPNIGAVIGEDGNDIMLNNKRDNVWMDGGEDDDLVKNYNSSNVSVHGGAGNDVISNLNSPDTTINGGSGNDFIVSNYSANVSISTGSGNDSVSVYDSKNVSITTGDGDNSISNISKNVTISAGAGNDEIFNIGAHVSINSGDGSDKIESFGDQSTIDANAGDNYIAVSGDNVVINIGSGANSIETDEFYYGLIQTGNGADDIINFGDSNTIDASSGSNSMSNVGNSNKIFGGSDDDYIGSFGNENTLSAGDGNDYIELGGDSNSVDAGAGNDMILLYEGNNNTIDGGTGDDIIDWEDSSDIVVKYNLGDGNDTVYGFNETSTLEVSGGTGSYSSHKDGSDIIVTVGEGKIILVGAASLASVNIDGKETFSNPVWTLKKTTATYGTSLETLITVTGVKSLSGISLSGKKVTVKKASLGTTKVTISDGYTLALGNDAPKPSTLTTAHFAGLTFKSASSSEGYSLSTDKKSISYTPAVAESDLFTLTNVKNTDSIGVDTTKKTVTLKADNLTSKNVSITGDYSLKLGNDVSTSTIKTVGSFTKFKSGTATFKTTAYSDFYSLKNNQVTYTAASGGKAISIKNLKSSATLDEIKSAISVAELKNGTFKISFKNADVLTTKAPTISASGITYSVALNKALKPASLAPDWKVSGTNASLKSDTSAGYTVSDNKVFYSKKVTGSPQLVLGGLIKNSSLSAPVKKVVTLDSKILGSNASLKSNAGSYTVKLTGNMSKKTFTGSANADTLNIAANNAAVLGGAGNDSFTVTGTKVTLTGGKGNDSFKLSGKNPMLIYNTGDGNDTVNFVAGMQISLSGSTQIKTLGKSGSDLLLGFGKNSSVKVTGAKSTDTIKVSDTSGSVTLVAGKFDLANSLTFNSKNSSVTVAKNFTGSLAPSDDIYLGDSKLSSVATINAANVTDSITITANDKANFISAGKNNDSILGGNGNDSIAGNAGNDKLYGQNGNDSLSGDKGNDSLWGGDGKDIFIYSAGKDVIADFTAGQDKIQIASGKISKTSLSGSDVLFTIGKGSLTVKNVKGKTISLLDSTGKASSTVVGAQTLTNSNKASVTIGADMGAVDASARTKAIAITGNALANTICGGTKNDSIFGAAGNDSILGNAGNDKLYGDAGNDIIYGGKGNDSLFSGAGNDTLTGGDGNDFFIYEAGNDFISDYIAGQDKIQIASGKISKTSLSGSDVLFTIGKGSLTVKNAKGKTISLLDSTGKASSTVVGAQTLTNSNKASVTIGADMGAVDASARTKAIAITGNALANTICGGTKNDSLFGSAGNDSILGNAGNDKLFGDAGNDQLFGGNGNDSLWGGAGNDSLWGDAGKDTFIYTANEGTDKIFDYATGDMLKILNENDTDGSFKSSKYSGGDLTLTINGGGKIIFEDVASSTKFNINGSSYNISGSKLVKK